MRTLFALALLALLAAALAAGCAPAAVVVTATPAPRAGYLPYPTYADPALEEIRVQNTLSAVQQQRTQAAQFATATVQALSAQQALLAATQIAATQAGADAAQAVLAVTATAAGVGRAILDTTATAAAVGLADAQRRQAEMRTAEMADVARVAAEVRASEKAAYDLRLLLGVAAMAVLVFIGWAVADVIHVYLRAQIAVRTRRDLLVLERGFIGQYVEGQGWVQIGAPGGALPPGDGAGEAPPWLERLRARRAPEPAPLDEDIDVERAARDEWREAARRFLAWSAAFAADGAPVGLSRRRFLAATGCTRADYENARDLLVRLGLLVRRRDDTYKIRAGYTVDQALRAPVWATSFALPAGVKVPTIPEPPPARPGPARPSPAQAARPDPPEAADDAPPAIPAQWRYASRLATEFPPELHTEPDSSRA